MHICAAITVSVIADVFSLLFMILTVCFGFVLLIAVIVYFGYDIFENDTDIVVGRSGVFIVEVKNHNSHIEGDLEDMVYFANKTCLVSLTGNSDISVYSCSDSDEDRLCGRILSGNHNLDIGSINHICKLISQL